jgi:hypothetical protein
VAEARPSFGHAYGASFRAKLIKARDDPMPRRSDYNPSRLPESVVTELQLREFGPTLLPAYAETSAGIRSLSDDFMPTVVRKRAIVPAYSATVLPAWQLQGRDAETEPYWQLTNRKDECHALAREN